MHYPKFIYEALPYLYFFAGIILIHENTHFIFSIIGSLLFLFGAGIWIVRSNHRRIDITGHFIKSELLQDLSQKLYEFRPFVCLLISLLSVEYIDTSWVEGPSIILLIIAIWILTLRISNRHLNTKKSKDLTSY